MMSTQNIQLNTKKKEFENTLANLMSLIESSTDAIWMKDKDGMITSWNKGAELLYGYKRHEVLGKSINIVVPPDKRKELERIDKKVFQGQSIFNIETKRITKKGETLTMSVSFSPVKDANGTVVNTAAIARDITKQHNAEEKLRQSEERFRTLIEKSTDAIQLISAEGKVMYTSDSIIQILGYTPEEILGSTGEPYLHPDDAQRFYQVFSKLLEKPGNQVTLEYRVKHKNGSWVWLEATGVNHLDNPVINAIVGNFRDITDRKNFEKQKDDFVSIVSHELKTPVTSLKAFAQVLQSRFHKKGDSESEDLLSKMEAQINKLTNLIHDLLDMSKIEGGQLQFQNAPFFFDNLVIEVVEEIQRTTDILITVNGKTEKEVFGDKERIGQVIINFLTNAIKYSLKKNSIHVSMSVARKKVTLCVEDFGLGISKENQPHVFERFYRVSGKPYDTVPGIGLGLYISAEIMRRQKGKIWVESEEGRGSKFYFTLPALHKV